MRPKVAGPATRIPLFRPDTGEAEARAVAEVLASGWLTTGPRSGELEALTAQATGTTFARSVSSCSMGLFLSLRAIGVGIGDVVITTAMTFAASVQAILWTGARAVLADVDDSTLLLDARSTTHTADALRRHGAPAKAVIAVHYAGQPAEVEAISEAAGGIPVIEDAAHAWGTVVAVKSCIARCFSLYANKTITAGEGGVVVSDDPAVARYLIHGRDHGIDASVFGRQGDPTIAFEGFKGNLSDVNAAIAVVQLRRLADKRAVRQRIVRWYGDRLRGVETVRPLGSIDHRATCPHLYVVRVPAPTRDRVRGELHAAGIETALHYRPIHHHPWMASRVWVPGPVPVVEQAAKEMLTLPLHEFLTEADVDEICGIVTRAAR